MSTTDVASERQGSGEPRTEYRPATPPMYPRREPLADTMEYQERTPSFRYKVVRFLAGVGAFFSVPALAIALIALITGNASAAIAQAGVLKTVGPFVEMALAIPIYRAVKQRRRSGLLGLLFAQVGVIMQKGFAAFGNGGWASVFFSVVWLGILISIWDELDQ
jgi:hypothetical protein